MKLIFKQKMFSWFDSYNVFDESGNTVYVVKGQLSWGHRFKIFDASGNEVGEVVQKIITFMPAFEIFNHGQYAGSIRRSFSILPKYDIDFNNWKVSGSLFEFDYEIKESYGAKVAAVTKKLLNFTDTYEIDVEKPENALTVLMFVIAIDAEKCSRK